MTILLLGEKKFNLDGLDGFHHYWRDPHLLMTYSTYVSCGNVIAIGQGSEMHRADQLFCRFCGAVLPKSLC